jgi:hypothetical protein
MPLEGLSQKDWNFLCELAKENGTSPIEFASQMLASELARYRDEIAYAEEVQQEINTLINTHN